MTGLWLVSAAALSPDSLFTNFGLTLGALIETVNRAPQWLHLPDLPRYSSGIFRSLPQYSQVTSSMTIPRLPASSVTWNKKTLFDGFNDLKETCKRGAQMFETNFG